MKLLSLLVFLCSGMLAGVADLRPGPIPAETREQFHLSSFYQKGILLGGFPIIGSAKVSDAAIAECALIVQHMLERRPEILKALADAKVRFAVMAWNEFTTDIPEHSRLE